MRDMEASVKLEGSSSPPPDWKLTVESLIRGARDSASLLSCQLQDHASGSPSRVLAEGIIHSISRALLVLDDCEKSAVPTTTNPSPASSDDPQNEISSGKRKITCGRRVYRSSYPFVCSPRPISQSVPLSLPYSCTTITAKTIKDAYSWRKYGQKRIYNATFPRCYYRCTHKPDRGCQATRQVQQSEEDPTMFVITYMGEHTCRSGTTEPMTSAPLPIPKLDSDDEVVSSASPRESSLSEEHGFPVIMAVEALAPPPTLPLMSQISFDFSRDYWKFDFMSNNEYINLDDMSNFENDELS